jgi:hypothetical protein
VRPRKKRKPSAEDSPADLEEADLLELAPSDDLGLMFSDD